MAGILSSAKKAFGYNQVGDDSQQDVTMQYSSGAPPEYKQGGDDEMAYRRQVVIHCLQHKVTISDELLSRVLNISPKDLLDIKRQIRSTVSDRGAAPLSWDYVMCFSTGSDEPGSREMTRKERDNMPEDIPPEFQDEYENGMTQRKYYLQIVEKVRSDLEYARLEVRQFKSADGDHVFLVIGITEANLKQWADERNADLLLEPAEACEVGRENGFPLALRTIKTPDEEMDGKHTLPLENWASMYCKYDTNVKQDIYKHYPRLPESDMMTPFSEKVRLRIIYEAIVADQAEGGAEIEITDHVKSKKHPMIACFPLHRQSELDIFEQDWLTNHNPRDWFWVPQERIRMYFGEPVAFYFAFMTFYVRWLVGPSILGIIFFIVQMGTGEIDADGIWILGLFVIFWCVAFVDFWARQEGRLRLQWGMTKFEEKAVARPQFKGEWIHDDVTGLWSESYSFIRRMMKGSTTLSFVILFIGGCVVAFLQILFLRDRGEINPFLAGVVNGIMISIFDFGYRLASRYGNEWENHRTEQDFQNALIFKTFIFKFCNSFSTLFYMAFIRGLLYGNGWYIQRYDSVCGKCTAGELRQTAGDGCVDKDAFDGGDLDNKDWLCCMKQDKDTFFVKDANGDPTAATFKFKGCSQRELDSDVNDQINSDLRIQLSSLFLTAIFIQNTVEVLIPWLWEKYQVRREEREAEERGEDIAPKSEAELQMIKLPYENTIDDMSEIVIQFGFVTLFIMALPLTPFMALINNVIELKVDGVNLVRQSQRPHPNGSYGLGAWNQVLTFFSIIAVGTNVAIFTWRTDLVADAFHGDSTSKWVFFSIVSVCLALLVTVEKIAIPDEPLEVTQGIERQRLIENVLINGAQLEKDDDEVPVSYEDDEEYPFNPQLDYTQLQNFQDIPLGDLSQLSGETAGDMA